MDAVMGSYAQSSFTVVAGLLDELQQPGQVRLADQHGLRREQIAQQRRDAQDRRREAASMLASSTRSTAPLLTCTAPLCSPQRAERRRDTRGQLAAGDAAQEFDDRLRLHAVTAARARLPRVMRWRVGRPIS